MHKNIVLIGSGRFGQSVGYLLEQAGADLAIRTTRTNAALRLNFKSTPKTLLYDSKQQGKLKTLSDELEGLSDILVLIAVHDDELKRVAEQISELRLSWKNCSVIHGSASFDEKILKPFAERGARLGALHLTCPISSPVEKFTPSSAFTFCGDKDLGEVLTQVITAAGYEFIKLNDVNRTLYHSGCVMAAGHVAALITVAGEILATSGIAENEVKKILYSLLTAQSQGLQNLDEGQAISKLLTGPFIRRDKQTIEKHIATLREISPKFVMLYDLLGNLTTSLTTSKPPQPIQ